MRIPLLLSLVLLAPAAATQVQHVVPPNLARMWGSGLGSGTGVAAYASSRVQYVYDSPITAGTMVQQIGFRGRGDVFDIGAYTVDGQISMSSTPIPPEFLSSTFASNRGSDFTVVLPRQVLNVAAQPANRSPSSWIPYPLQSPFVFGTNGAPHLMVEVSVWSTTSSLLLLDQCDADPLGASIVFGRGCGPATIGFGGTPSSGATIDVSIHGARPGRLAWLLGGNNVANLGPVPLPLDLGLVLGMAGCNLFVDPVLPAVALTIDGNGEARQTLPVPPTLSDEGWAFQWLYQDPGALNPLGLFATAGRVVHIGPRVCSSSGHVLSSSPTAASGFVLAGAVALQVVAQ